MSFGLQAWDFVIYDGNNYFTRDNITGHEPS